MAEMITRCPQCSTSFRITPAQIQKARGAVRCGSCLHIFNAQKHLIEGKPAEKKAPRTKPKPQQPAPQQESLAIEQPSQAHEVDKVSETPTPEAIRPASSTPEKLPPESPTPVAAQEQTSGLKWDQAQIDEESDIPDDQLISDNMGREVDEDDELMFIGNRDSKHSLFDRKITEDKEEFIDDSDESWAQSLLDDDPDTSAESQAESHFDNPLSITAGDPHTPALETNTNAATHSDNASQFTERDIEQLERGSYDALRESFAGGSTMESASDSQTAYTNQDAAPDEAESIDEFEDDFGDDFGDDRKRAPTPKFQLTGDDDDEHGDYSERLRAFDNERSALLMGIDPVPVEMTGESARQWKKRLLWGGASLLAVLLLVAQIAWLQFDRLSRLQPYRDYYSSACDLLGCTLPELSDSRQIRAFNLVVRNHPQRAAALMVDAIILNGAPFTQAYPKLQLTFTDINNNPVASRVFTPQEYLKGELSGSKIMPKNQPVHLSLELADPGDAAVNYRLDIR